MQHRHWTARAGSIVALTALAVLVGLLASIASPGVGPASAAPASSGAPRRSVAPATVRVAGVDAVRGGDVTLTVSVPTAAAVALPATAFRVSQNGRPVAAHVDRLPNDALRVVFVVGAPPPPPLTDPQGAQNAAIETLVRLPGGAQAGVLDGTGSVRVVQPLTPELGGAVRALAELAPTDPDATGHALDLAVTHLANGAAGRRALVVVTANPNPLTDTAAQALGSRLATTGTALYVVPTGRGPAPTALAQLAAASGGGVYGDGDPARLIETLDLVTSDLLSQYRIAYRDVVPNPNRITLTIDAGPVRGEATAVVPSQSGLSQRTPRPTATAGQAGRGGSGTGWALPVAVLIAALVLLVGLVLLRRRIPAAAAARTAAGTTGADDVGAATAVAGGGIERAATANAGIATPTGPPAAAGASGGSSRGSFEPRTQARPREGLWSPASSPAAALPSARSSDRTADAPADRARVGATAEPGRLPDRRDRRSAALAEGLRLLVEALRSGTDPADAVEGGVKALDDRTGAQVRRRLARELRRSADVEAALLAFAVRERVVDGRLLAAAVESHRRLDTDLATLLDQVADRLEARAARP